MSVCVCVWPLIGSAPGHDRNMRPVSIEPLWPEVETFEKKIPSKWPMAKLPSVKCFTLNAFLWEKLLYIFPVHWMGF